MHVHRIFSNFFAPEKQESVLLQLKLAYKEGPLYTGGLSDSIHPLVQMPDYRLIGRIRC
jgi:hypothetical protein